MGTVTAMTQGTEVARPTKVLIPLIKEDLANGKEAAKQAGMPYYRAAGEKLLEAQPQVKESGERWEGWVKRNFNISQSVAYEYMRLAKDSRAREFPSMREFQRHTGRDPRPSTGHVYREWTSQVDGIAERTRRELDRLQEEHLSRQQEREADIKLALRLIDIGYKVLAKELHPDKGGSRDAMQRLTRVRENLKSCARK